MAPPIDDGAFFNWTMARWVESLGISSAVAAAMPVAGANASVAAQLAALRSLGAREEDGREALASLLETNGVVEALVDTIWPAVCNLRASSLPERPPVGLMPPVPPPRLNAECILAMHTATGPAYPQKDHPSSVAGVSPTVLLDLAQGMHVAGGNTLTVGGLTHVVGRPAADPFEGMRAEHCEYLPESDTSFVEPTYGISTTPRIEWWFVAEPEQGLEATGRNEWPSEDPTTIDGPARPRLPRPLAAFDDVLEDINERLAALTPAESPPVVSHIEILAGRLFTGPMGAKYQAALRGCAHSDLTTDGMLQPVAPASRIRGSAFVAAGISTHGNKYQTTLHTINSLVVKLGRLSDTSCILYRSVVGGLTGLPPSVRDDGARAAHGVRGFVDAAFTCGTMELADALRHATIDFRVRRDAAARRSLGDEIPSVPSGAVLAIRASLDARVARLASISQYPHESMVALQPLTRVQLTSTHCEGDVMILEASTTPLLPPITLETTLSKRRALLEAQAVDLAEEVQGTLHGTVWAPVGDAWSVDILDELRGRTDEWYRCHRRLTPRVISRAGPICLVLPPSDPCLGLPLGRYHDDGGELDASRFVTISTELVDAKAASLGTPQIRLEYAQMRAAAYPAIAYAASAAAVELIGGKDDGARDAAVSLLLPLDVSYLGRYLDDLIAHLEQSSHSGVCHAALQVIKLFPPEQLAPHVATTVMHLSHAADDVRISALDVLGAIEPYALLASANGRLRPATVQVLSEVHPTALAMHTPSIVAHMLHTNPDIRKAALQVLRPLHEQGEVDAVAWLVPAMLAQLADRDDAVRAEAAAQVSTGIDTRALLAHISLLIQFLCLEPLAKREKNAIISALKRVDPEAVRAAANEVPKLKGTLKSYRVI